VVLVAREIVTSLHTITRPNAHKRAEQQLLYRWSAKKARETRTHFVPSSIINEYFIPLKNNNTMMRENQTNRRGNSTAVFVSAVVAVAVLSFAQPLRVEAFAPTQQQPQLLPRYILLRKGDSSLTLIPFHGNQNFPRRTSSSNTNALLETTTSTTKSLSHVKQQLRSFWSGRFGKRTEPLKAFQERNSGTTGTASATNSGYDPLNNRHSASDWLYNVRSLPQSKVLREIRNPVLAVAAWSASVSILHALMKQAGWTRWAAHLCIPGTAHSFLVSALGLLLVFRTNSAYQRFNVRTMIIVSCAKERNSEESANPRLLESSLALSQPFALCMLYRRAAKFGKTY
jgi:Bestrophin, RFP-TM, chloride channel